METTPFDVLIIDEAAQVRECESVIPLRLHGFRHAILVGDDCQLQPIVQSHVMFFSRAQKPCCFETAFFFSRTHRRTAYRCI